jgi:predicted nucleotidyltransferase
MYQEIHNLIKKSNENGNEAYLFGSYVYNKLIKNNDDFNDIDILVKEPQLFEYLLLRYTNCFAEKYWYDTYGFLSYIRFKCHGFDKKIEIHELEKYMFDNRNNKFYDFQRILYNGDKFTSLDNKIDIDGVIEDYKDNKVCFIPKDLYNKEKYINKFNFTQQNIAKCIFRDIYKYKFNQIKTFYFKEE